MHAVQSTARLPVFGRMLLCVVIVSMLLGGCAGAPGGDARVVDGAEVVEGYDCLAPNLNGWILPPEPAGPADPEHPDAPDPGRVPAGFTPTIAVRCDPTAAIEDAEGQWSGVTATTLTGDLTPLLEALAEPDDEPGLGPCTADMELVSPLWLVDATGQAIHVHYPRTRCAKTKPDAHSALAGLSVQGTTTLKRTLVVPRAAVDSGCAAEWTAPFDEGALLSIPSIDSSSGAGTGTGTEGASPVAPLPMADTLLTDVDGMRWCRYAVESIPPETAAPGVAEALPATTPPHSGRFVAGGTLDTATARSLTDVAASEPMSPSCDESATLFLVLWPSREGQDLGAMLTVELDGCRLLYRNGGGARTLPPDVLELLSAQTGP